MKEKTKLFILFMVMVSVVLVFRCATTANAGSQCNDNWYVDEFMILAGEGSISDVKRKISKGMDINVRDRDCSTALMFASLFKRINMVKFLIAHGADVNSKNKDGYTALTFASGAGCIDIVKFLIAHGANVNSKDRDGYTELMKAKGEKGVVKILKAAGAKE